VEVDSEQFLTSLSAAELAAARPRRVALFVEPSPFSYVSGYNTRFRNTIAQLVAQGSEVLVVTTGAGRSLPGVDFSAGVEPPPTWAGAKVVGAPSFGCPAYWQAPLSFAATPRVWRELSSFKPDLIHVTTPGVMCVAAWAYARLLDVPLFMSYHTHVPSYLPSYGLGWLKGAVWALIRTAHSKAHFSIAASQSLAQELVAARACPPHRTAAWRKAVDEELFNPRWRDEGARRRLAGVPADAASPPPLLLYVGRLGAEKNVSFLQPLLARLPSARLAIVGDGPARAELEAAFAADPATAGRARFHGTLRGPALSAAFASADVFCMPSETETLGFVVLEAMASGLPVVAVAAGGVPDIVTQPGRNGFLYAPGDGEGAAAAAAALLRDPALRARVGAAAAAEAASWGWAAATRHMVETQYAAAVALHAAGLFAREGPLARRGGRASLVAAAKLGAKVGLAGTGAAGARSAGRAGKSAGGVLVRRLAERAARTART